MIKASRAALKAVCEKTFLPGNVLSTSFQSGGTGITWHGCGKDTGRNFISDDVGKPFATQLGLAREQPPFYLTNGTMQGAFSGRLVLLLQQKQGHGPTTNIQLMMPCYETSPQFFWKILY